MRNMPGILMALYTDDQLWDISRAGPVSLHRYYRHMILHWRWRACKQRMQARRLTTKEGQDHWLGRARLEDRMATSVLHNMDAMVRTTLEPAICTCSSIHRQAA